ncbi:MAG: hypothetical protein HYX89_04060 [Chloroflexi bacterium]|nr:hypothetical protein [Chloroflexota bacterium]
MDVIGWLKQNFGAILAAALIVLAIGIGFFAHGALNENSGAVQAVAVSVLVIITGYYALQTRRQADANNEMVKGLAEQLEKMAEQTREMALQRDELVKARKATFIPILVPTDANLQFVRNPENKCYEATFVIENAGEGPVFNIRRKIEPGPFKEADSRPMSMAAMGQLQLSTRFRLGWGETLPSNLIITLECQDVFNDWHRFQLEYGERGGEFSGGNYIYRLTRYQACLYCEPPSVSATTGSV